MKFIFFFFSLFISTAVFSQTEFLKAAVVKLDKALIEKDTSTLKQVLHKDLSYGHSTGWVENKDEVLKNLQSGKLVYNKIKSKDHKWTVTPDIVMLRTTSDISYRMDGKDGELNLHVLQIWTKTNKGWQLLARQSTKL